MLTLIEALNFRCLRYIRQPLGPFHVLVGPNASGKTTFLDVVAFLGRFVSDGLDAAIAERTENFADLVWGRRDGRFELAIEVAIPEARRKLLRGKGAPTDAPSRNQPEPYDTMRYEVAVWLNPETGETEILGEKATLKSRQPEVPIPRTLFPLFGDAPSSILTPKIGKGTRTILNKVPSGNDNFYSEVHQESGKGWMPAFKLGPRKSALGNLPEDESKFPVATWLKELLTAGVQPFVLNSLRIRKASPPGQLRGFRPDGSNIPWVLAALRRKSLARFRDWLAHVRTALPDLEDIHTVERKDDRHRYLMIRYAGGLEVPSWMASDGTLRLLALTLPAYLPDFQGVYLIEEPENGIHPRAVETMFQSLASVYDAQMLLATHSPVILSVADAAQVLCFAKTAEGATDIVLGRDHPRLKEWQGETNLGMLLAAGVLG